MIYMVEMDFPHSELLAEWEVWYAGHLRNLLSISGILSAQRFKAVAPDRSPYLAIYGIAHAHVLSGDEYRTRAGPTSTKEWGPRMTN